MNKEGALKLYAKILKLGYSYFEYAHGITTMKELEELQNEIYNDLIKSEEE